MLHPDGTLYYEKWAHFGMTSCRLLQISSLTSFLDHCVEIIRQALTCFSDISALNYQWIDSKKRLMPKRHSVHMCRNFEKIQDWALSRLVDGISTRGHVEDGVAKDYSDLKDEWQGDTKPPEGFKYDIGDL